MCHVPCVLHCLISRVRAHPTAGRKLHHDWSMRITNEFWALGDKERNLGVQVSPLCDRVNDKDIAKSQIGFFQFVCNPFFEQVADLVDPEMVPYLNLKSNFGNWKTQHAANNAANSADGLKQSDGPAKQEGDGGKPKCDSTAPPSGGTPRKT